ncbi:MAG: hypothetical protein ACI8W8_003665 [Rhodothermales bacterium]|jgi:hypothetical protein
MRTSQGEMGQNSHKYGDNQEAQGDFGEARERQGALSRTQRQCARKPAMQRRNYFSRRAASFLAAGP